MGTVRHPNVWARYRYGGAIQAHLGIDDPFGYVLTVCGKRFRRDDVVCAPRGQPLCDDCAKTVRVVRAPEMPRAAEVAE